MRNLINYFIVAFAILWSGGAATYALFNDWSIYGFFLGVYLLKKRGISLGSSDYWLLILLNGLVLVQMMVYGGSFTTLIHQVLIATCAYFAAKLVAKDFASCFVNIMVLFAVISLPFYIAANTGFYGTLLSIADGLPQLGVDNMMANGKQTDLHTLYLYNVYDSDFSVMNLRRNPGPFWEPGRFTIFLNLAIIINLFYFKETVFSKKSIILILANITAMSTTGIVAMVVIFFAYSIKGNMSLMKKTIVASVLLACLPTILSLDFMSDKIGEEMGSDATYSRFGAIAYHMTQIEQSPFLGFGPFLSTVFGRDLASSPNGVSDSVRFFGIPVAIYIWFLLYRGTKVYVIGKFERIVAFVVLMMLAFTQTIMMSPFYYMLYFFANSKGKTIKKYA